MARAWIDGKPAALERAIGEAAKMLAASRCPLIAGLGTDVAGARAAISLAERIGGVVDHMNSDALFRDLAVVREAGVMATTPSEARIRADVLLLVGPGLENAWLAAAEGRETVHSRDARSARSIVRLCPGRPGAEGDGIRTLGSDPDQLPVVLAALRARLAGRSAGNVEVAGKALDELATLLRAAKFGVTAWSAASLDALVIEMLCGMVADLNAETRFAGFALAPGENAVGVLQTCGWMTGFPMRTGFGRGYPEHDPWRFDGKRMVASREADCVLWISAFGAAAPDWGEGPPVISLMTGDAVSGRSPSIQIEVGRPGIDHDGIEHHAGLGTLVAIAAARPSETVSVAGAIGRILAALPEVSPGAER